jgi:hypothetical protein
VHLDIAPWEYATDSPSLRKTAGEMQYERLEAFRHENNAVTASDGRAVQGLINLVDNCAADGGTLVVPQFHRHFDTWLESQGEGAFAPGVTAYKGTPALARQGSFGRRAVRVTARRGSLLCWDSRLIHGSAPNKSAATLRIAQFLKLSPARGYSAARLRARGLAVRPLLQAAGLWAGFRWAGYSGGGGGGGPVGAAATAVGQVVSGMRQAGLTGATISSGKRTGDAALWAAVANEVETVVAAVARGVRVIKFRFQSKRTQRYIRLQLFPSTFK